MARKRSTTTAEAKVKAEAPVKAAPKNTTTKAAAPGQAASIKLPPTKGTRAETFDWIVKNNAPLTKAQLHTAMHQAYGGSIAEAKFQVDLFVRLLLAMGFMQKVDRLHHLVK
jgi:hypothetical protein